MALSNAKKNELKAAAHELEPVVQIGLKGVTAALIKQVNSALDAHELIKVKLGRNLPEDAPPPADALAIATRSEVIQEIGKVIVLFRENEERRKAERDAAKKKRRDAERKAILEEKAAAAPRRRRTARR